MKRLIYICLFITIVACKNSNRYQIEGRLSNLDNPTLYVVFESLEGNAIDTVFCDAEGHFSIIREHKEEYQTIVLYYNGRRQWLSIFPETGKPIQIKGDADYPQSIQIKGGRINNKLSEFKKKAAPLLKKLAEISASSNETALINGEETLQLANINHELRRAVQDFIIANPNEEASAILISDYFVNPDEIGATEEMLKLLSPDLNDYYVVKNLKAQVDKAKATMEGAKAPDFKVTNINGQTYTPDSLANKYYILAFTALWCDMCQTEVLMLDEIVNKYPKDSLDILLISLDDEFEEVRDMIRQDTIAWNLVTDSAGQAIQLFETYNVSALPKCFLMDKDGIIKLRTTNGEELRQAVDEIMK